MTDELDKSQEIEGEEPYAEERIPEWLADLQLYGHELNPFVEFVPECPPKSVGLKKARFKRDLQEFIDKVKPVPLRSSLVESLYQRAVSDLQHVAAWSEIERFADSQEFKQWRAYIKQEKRRYSKILKNLHTPAKKKAPSWTSAWNKDWVETFACLCRCIVGQLSFAEMYSQQLFRITAVRLKVEQNQLVGVFDEISILFDGLKGA
jgi:hypothetical protein